jgi:hypothetical protein
MSTTKRNLLAPQARPRNVYLTGCVSEIPGDVSGTGSYGAKNLAQLIVALTIGNRLRRCRRLIVELEA